MRIEACVHNPWYIVVVIFILFVVGFMGMGRILLSMWEAMVQLLVDSLGPKLLSSFY